MKKNFKMKRILAILFVLFIAIQQVLAYELDTSVDEEIKKKYDVDKLKYDVPIALPKTSATHSSGSGSVPKTTPVYTTTAPNITIINQTEGIKISSGTKFQVRSNQMISDNQRAGTNISFTSFAPVYKKHVTIPSGTKFYGVIEESHQPQKTGNGGLIVIRLTGMSFNGKNYPIEGKITKANSKNIFFNNIKGKRQYWYGVGKQIDKGEKFYQKTRRTSAKMADNPILVILSPIPTVAGLAGYSVYTVLSPITALATTGGKLSIPSGSAFEIKLLNPAYVR